MDFDVVYRSERRVKILSFFPPPSVLKPLQMPAWSGPQPIPGGSCVLAAVNLAALQAARTGSLMSLVPVLISVPFPSSTGASPLLSAATGNDLLGALVPTDPGF